MEICQGNFGRVKETLVILLTFLKNINTDAIHSIAILPTWLTKSPRKLIFQQFNLKFTKLNTS